MKPSVLDDPPKALAPVGKAVRRVEGKVEQREDDVLFETFWRVYPKRDGSNSKIAARKIWDRNRKAGIEPDDMIAGAQRYAAYSLARGDVGTRTVMQATRFVGPEEHWTELWSIAMNGHAKGQKPKPYDHYSPVPTAPHLEEF